MYKLTLMTMNPFHQLYEILDSLKSKVRHAWTPSRLRFSMTHTKSKFTAPDNTTTVSGTAVAHTGSERHQDTNRRPHTASLCAPATTTKHVLHLKSTLKHVYSINPHICIVWNLLYLQVHCMEWQEKEPKLTRNGTSSRIKMTWKK